MQAPAAFAPFRNRQYRVLIAGLSASMVGAGMWAVAMVYQVIAIGGGALELSVVATVNSVGMIAFILLGGVTADRLPRRRVLIAVEAANLVAVSFTAVLSVTGVLTLAPLCVSAFVLGVSLAFFYPAYSALLPQILPARQLLAANGMEGTVRPVLQQAAGPALAGVLVAALTPGPAILAIAACHAVALVVLTAGLPRALDTAPLRFEDNAPTPSGPVADPRIPAPMDGPVEQSADGDDDAEHGDPAPPRSVWADLREGVAFTVRTRWLFWTLCWAVFVVLLFIGPLEVLLPFLVRDQLGGGSQTFGFLLAIYGVGAAAGSLLTASLPLPRHYLTVMIAVWGFGMLPLAVLGYTDRFAVMAVALFVCSFTGGVGQVIWGTLLQRRVPPALLGRISSLDFFVSLALMPVSMALAGPVAQVVDVGTIFVVVAVASPLLGIIALVAGRLRRDEREHPLREEAALA
ncbi:MFS transporter [Tersicoccus sp. Bi-70]|uniref:MFS transporter n=1 Tax=Tersicoccus sp. Bi-70 TaxID=1897634 RepID=UPI000975E0FF|nr:MFS transporter [Tersicoccus sp. Bi-70]OMH34231.1 MFS transporter [Tersicoccus sp. Bi-70]